MADLKLVAEALRKNNMEAYVAENRTEVLKLLGGLLPEGAVVGSGGSMTLDECGVTDFLRNGKFVFHERKSGLTPAETEEIFEKQRKTDFYFCSSNAVTEAGELYNVDGRANRVAAIAHGPKKVITIAGKNKIVKNIIGAVERVKTVAAPKNAVRLNYQTPCQKTGQCIAIRENRPFATDGCLSPDRICCHYLITGFQKNKNRITVILVNENLGY